MYEITTGRFAKFLTANGGVAPPDYWEDLKLERDSELPVVGVSWHGCRRLLSLGWQTATHGCGVGKGGPRHRFPQVSLGRRWSYSEHANFLNDADAPYPNGLHPSANIPKEERPRVRSSGQCERVGR